MAPRISASRRSDGSADINVQNGTSGFHFVMPPEEVHALVKGLLEVPVEEEWAYKLPGSDYLFGGSKGKEQAREEAKPGGIVLKRWISTWMEVW